MESSPFYNDLIYLFLDGEATETEASVLLKAMAENPELQTEFQQVARLHGSLQSVRRSVATPPADLASSVFQAIGFGTHLSESQVVMMPARSLFKRLFSALLIFSMGYLASWFLPVSIPSPEYKPILLTNISTPYQLQGQKSGIHEWTLSMPAQKNDIDMRSAAAHEPGKSDKQKRYSALYPESAHTMQPLQAIDTYTAAYQAISKPASDYYAWSDMAGRQGSVKKEQMPEIIVEKEEKPEFIPSSVWLEYMPTTMNTQRNLPAIPLLSTSILWRHSPNVELGAQIGSLSFNLPGPKEINESVNNVSLLYGAFCARISMEGIAPDMPFFTDLALGASDIGPLARLRLGLLYNPSPDFSVGIMAGYTAQGFKSSAGWTSLWQGGLSVVAGVHL